MKKSTWIALLLVVPSIVAWGQARNVHPLQETVITWGVRGGINFSVMDPESLPGSAPIGYHVLHGGYTGAFLHQFLARRLALRPELLLSVHGFGAQHDARYTFMIPEDDHYLLGYIHLPLLLQYVFPAGVVLQGGLQPGVVWYRYQELKPADLAWVVGAGHMFSSGVGVEVRYVAGLVNLANRDYEYNYLAKVKNKVVQLGLVYQPNLKRHHSKAGCCFGNLSSRLNKIP